MIHIQRILGLCLLLIIAGTTIQAAPAVREILEQIDNNENIDKDFTGKLTITHQKPSQGVKVYESIYYRRDADDAFLMVMVAPDADKGNGYLRVEKNMWMYRRNTRTFQMMNRDQSLEGTNASAEDIEKKKLNELYDAVPNENGQETLSEETLGKAKIHVYRIELQAKVHDVKYPKEIIWVRQDNFLVMKSQSYSLSGTLMETSYYPQYVSLDDGKYLAVRSIFINEFEEGEKTILEVSGFSWEPIDDTVFTKAYLENVSK